MNASERSPKTQTDGLCILETHRVIVFFFVELFFFGLDLEEDLAEALELELPVVFFTSETARSARLGFFFSDMRTSLCHKSQDKCKQGEAPAVIGKETKSFVFCQSPQNTDRQPRHQKRCR